MGLAKNFNPTYSDTTKYKGIERINHMPTKKAPAKKAAKKASKAPAATTRGKAGTNRLDSQADKITKLRDSGKVWKEIADAVGGTVGQVIFTYEKANVKPSERIKDITGKDVVRLRKEGVSWGRISVRGGITEVKARSLFEATTGDPSLGQRIGKGGRHPVGSNVVSMTQRKAAKAAGKGAAKKAAKSAAKSAKKSAPAKRRPVKKAAATAAE